MHHSMLPLIVSCTRSWNFAWHPLWRSTTESKNIVKLLAISQTSHTLAARKIIFQRENLHYLIVCFTQCTLFFFFKKSCFLLQTCLPCVICGSYVTKINAVLWHMHSARQTFASLGLFTLARIAYLLQLWIKLLYLGDAQITGYRLLYLSVDIPDTRQKKHVLISRQTCRVLSPNIWSLTAVKANCRAKGKLFIRFLSARPLIFNFSEPWGIFLA